MEAWENSLRAAVLSAGAKALASLLDGVGCGRQDEAIVCNCGARMESHGLKSKPLLTILGPVDYKRSLFQCPACNQTRYPGDEQLDVVDTTRSPGTRRMMARAGRYLFTADAGVGAGQKRPPRLSYSACSGPGGSRFANWANGLNGLRASWVD